MMWLTPYLKKIDEVIENGFYKANWDSLSQFEMPDWFHKAKFGIFMHWGVYSVPAHANEWYSRNMYQVGSKAYEHHLATYGAHKDFGYKDFIPMFKAEKFDASKIEGRMLINIDSEEEGIFTCGCAGGCRINAELPIKRLFDNSRKVISDDIYKYRYYNVVLDGLIGGHSGCDIDKHRVCANHCLGSVLHDINSDIQVYICHINGGKFDNVISEKASACVAVERDSSEAFLDALQSFEDKLKEEYEQDDPGISLKATEIPETELTFTHVPLDGESSNHILDMIPKIENENIQMENWKNISKS